MGQDYAAGMYIPTIDEQGKSVLRVIQRTGVAPGWQLMSEASVTADQLAKATGQLISMGLISANTNNASPSDIAQVYFNIQPSNYQFAEMVLNSNPDHF
jgi:hypothetical protein